MIGAARLPNISGPNTQQVEAFVVGDAVGTSADVAKFGSRSYKAWNGTGNSTTYIQMTAAPGSSWVLDYPPLKANKEFTAEFWIYMTAAPTTTVNMWQRIDFSTEWRFLMQANRIAQFRYRYYNPYPTTVTERVISSNVVTALNTWTHLAFTRQEGVVRFFQDGNLIATFTETGFVESGNAFHPYAIGQGVESGMRYYIDELRISDVCRYTKNFTPQSVPFAYDNRTLALLHFEESAGSKKFLSSLDPEVRPISVARASGSAQISTTQNKFNGSALYTPGAGGANHSVVLPFTTDLLWSQSTNYTMECWTYHTAWPTSAGYPTVGTGEGSAVTFLLGRTTGYVRWCFGFNATGKLTFDYNNSNGFGGITTQESTASGVLNTWQHIALVKQGTSIKGYVNGVQKISTTISGTVSIGVGDEVPRIGGHYWSASCYYDEIRWSNTARYTANFTPSTTPFTNDNNTVLLLHMDGSNGTTYFEDDNGVRNKKSCIAYGNAKLTTADRKFGNTSAVFDGSGDFVNIAPISDFNFGTGEFTIEAWCKFPIDSQFKVLFCTGGVSGTNIDFAIVNSTIQLHRWGGGYPVLSADITGVDANAWHHVAVSRVGTTCKIFLDGVAKVTRTSDTYSWASGTPVQVGYDNYSNDYYNGYIGELRVSNIGRYSADFTPLQQPFVNDANTVLLMHMDGNNNSTVFLDDNG